MGIIFEKSYNENRYVYVMYTIKPAGELRSAGDPSPAIDDFKNYVGDVWFCFRHNFSENYLQDLKIV